MAVNHILLLEDDEGVAELLVLVLRTAGYIVDLAVTVAQAERRLGERDYGLVIADWRLPDGDGIVVADRAADLGAKTAILSGYALQMSPERTARHDIWMKPMRPSELIAAVERSVGKAETR
jgi:two-component system response regulator PilR (NtrC family)